MNKNMSEAERRQILDETVRQFGKQEWFRDATVYNAHPDTGQATLEFKVNYLPVFERKNIMAFANRCGLSDRIVVVDKNGNPAN